jgi:G3E family GTPase
VSHRELDSCACTEPPIRQIASSDVVLVNKCDMSEEANLFRIEATTRKLNPAAKIFRTVKGELDVRKILNLAAYSSAPLHLTNTMPSHPEHVHGAPNNHHDHSQNDPFGGVSALIIPLSVVTPIIASKLDEWLRTLLWEGRLLVSDSLAPGGVEAVSTRAMAPKIEILRCKGVYATSEGRTFVIQGVRMLYETREATVDPSAFEGGKLVLIGKLGEASELLSSCTLYTGAVRTL